MNFKCSLNKWRTNKRSARLTLLVGPEDVPMDLYNFEDKPLDIILGGKVKIKGEIKNIEQLVKGKIKIVIITTEDYKKDIISGGPGLKNKEEIKATFLIDANEQVKRMNMISGRQRRKAFATIKDIAESTGNEKDEMYRIIKDKFSEVTGYGEISLSDCTRETAALFIEYCIRLGYENGVEWKEHPRERMDNLYRWLKLCLDQKICAVSGLPGKEYLIDNSGAIIHAHHTDAIGMGRNRQKFDDSKLKKISLSAKYHNEAHSMGWESFKEKYHVEGIIYP